ncbi:glycosyltransferase [Salinisphaera sp. USBA-960]|uniref:bacteriohopanetetrol glucosamine biosynthesis glycosyltransferase HpnI n=1 Tax=Salinisphaera orenii TaxID=856731 RepID=UPI0013A63FC3|nr:glycosyltransferase [Salifodinibacter halophilus]NNC26625.1 glycosyltransferase [Salifodinibacter halophilus]
MQLVGGLAAGVAFVYTAAAAILVRRGPPAPRQKPRPQPPVTILKPLCGQEQGLEDCLRSFCTQDYPQYQIVFGVADANDPALTVVERLQATFDSPMIDVVVDPTQHGSNRKVSNLLNMLPRAAHDTLIVADSDIRVDSDYLERIIATLNTHPRAVVTCAYRAFPGPSIWSRLGALFVNGWFLPSVLISQRLGQTSFGFGSTLAFNRSMLDSAGGFQAVADELADDHALTERVAQETGESAVLSDYVVETVADEPTLSAMLAHETRWMRTIRLLASRRYCLTILSFGLPVTCIAIGLGYTSPVVWALVTLTAVSRIDLHRTQAHRLGHSPWRDLWLLPVRGVLNGFVWLCGFGRRAVDWRGRQYAVDSTGTLQHNPRD